MANVCMDHGLPLSEIIYYTWEANGINHVCGTCCCLPIFALSHSAHKSIKEILYWPQAPNRILIGQNLPTGHQYKLNSLSHPAV